MTQSARHSSARPADNGRHRQPGSSRSQPARKWPVLITLLGLCALVGAFLVPQWLTGTPAGAGDDRPGAASTSSPAQPVVSPAAVTSPSSTARTAGGPAGTDPVGAVPGPALTPALTRSVPQCPLAGEVLRIAAAPELAGAVRAAIGAATVDSCRVEVTPLDPALFVAGWKADPEHRPQVWIPDSSVWRSRAAAAGIPVGTPLMSVASSPVVLAVSATAAARLRPAGAPTLGQVLGTRLTSTPIRIALPDPRASMPAVDSLLAIQRYSAGSPAARSALTWAVGSSPARLPTQATALLAHVRTDPYTAVPVSEQAVVTHNRSRAGSIAVAVYNGVTGVGLDYPLLVIGADRAAAGELRALQTILGSTGSQRQFAAAGFRNPAGHSDLEPTAGVDSSAKPAGAAPTMAVVDGVLHDVAVLEQPSRLLAVIDVSGSMGSAVAGRAGATRLDLAKSAAARGLALYPSDSQVGIWTFSRNLTARTDYRELVPVAPLTAVSGGQSGAARVAAAIAGAQVNPDGATGLYDTTLAAVRSMAARWDPERVNAVLILSDGQNDDQGGLTLPALLRTLQQEQDPSRPVPVITIGLGPDSDVDALSQISRSTGGAAYVARNPADIGQIFLDAVGQRLCRPQCRPAGS